MQQTNDRDALRCELIRLLKGVDFYRGWRLASLKRDRIGMTEEDLEAEVVVPGAWFLQIFDDTKGKRCAEVLKGVRVWYAQAESELAEIANLSEKDRRDVDHFLTSFKKEVGFSFHAESGAFQAVADRVLQRGRVQDAEEYYILHNCIVDGADVGLNIEERRRVAALVHVFEDTQAAGKTAK